MKFSTVTHYEPGSVEFLLKKNLTKGSKCKLRKYVKNAYINVKLGLYGKVLFVIAQWDGF